MKTGAMKFVTGCVLVVWALVESGCGFSQEYKRAVAHMEAAHQARKAREARARAEQARNDFVTGRAYFVRSDVPEDMAKGLV